jgi:2'-5' RNA ligase
MYRVISAFRLIPPIRRAPGPLVPSADSDVPAEAIGDFLDAIYIAVEKMRAFGLADKDIGGPIKVVARKPDERANGRYFPSDDRSVIFYPPVRGAPDWPWTIIHEVSHRVWNNLLPKESRKVWEMVANSIGKPIDAHAAEMLTKMVQNRPDNYNLWFFFKKHFGDDLNLFKGWLQTRRMSDAFPSDYANADPAECFAEVSADVILGRGHSGRKMRRTSSIVRKVFLSLVEPYLDRPSLPTDESVVLEQQDENFLQLQVDFPMLRDRVADWVQKNLRPGDIVKTPRSPHVTLLTGADKRDIPQIQQIAADFGRPIRMSLGAINVFEHPEHDVLYIEMVGDALPDMRSGLMKLPNTRPQVHAYRPHMTIAYLKKGAGQRFVGTFPIKGVARSYGLTSIDSNAAETTIPTTGNDALNREPLLLAGM